MRFAITARTLVRERATEEGTIREMTARNVKKVTQFRKDGQEALEREVRRLEMGTGRRRREDEELGEGKGDGREREREDGEGGREKWGGGGSARR